MQGGGVTALHRKAEIPHDWLNGRSQCQPLRKEGKKKEKKKGPTGNAKRRAPQEQQTSPGKEEVLQKSRAEANQNLSKGKGRPQAT